MVVLKGKVVICIFIRKIVAFLVDMVLLVLKFHKINEIIVQDVIRMGFDMNHLIKCLCNRVENEATVAYYLKFDYQFQLTGGGYLGAEFQKTTELSRVTPSFAQFLSLLLIHLNRLPFSFSHSQFEDLVFVVSVICFLLYIDFEGDGK
ncbi:Snf1 kinase-like protein [Thalictrum thalictroides]|uniref:Snf1 kinase-like protein n=1 Tax=Thalictrum thalictroides TaxID=46969 RepID=A0A7J6VKJ3_THATH|nr:Snf1 kinase-like protein [Thalictrum thalictroides]